MCLEWTLSFRDPSYMNINKLMIETLEMKIKSYLVSIIPS